MKSLLEECSTGTVVFMVNLTQVTEWEKFDVVIEDRSFLEEEGEGEKTYGALCILMIILTKAQPV